MSLANISEHDAACEYFDKAKNLYTECLEAQKKKFEVLDKALEEFKKTEKDSNQTKQSLSVLTSFLSESSKSSSIIEMRKKCNDQKMEVLKCKKVLTLLNT